MSNYQFTFQAQVDSLATEDPLSLFAQLSQYAMQEGQGFYQDQPAGICLGVLASALRVSGKNQQFEIKALNALGELILKALVKQLPGKLEVSSQLIKGELTHVTRSANLTERLKQHPVLALIRTLLLPVAANLPASFNGGLFGALAYDLVKQLEVIPDSKQDTLQDPDYLLYVPCEFFIIDPHNNRTQLVVLSHLEQDNLARQRLAALMYQAYHRETVQLPAFHSAELVSDTSQAEHEAGVRKFQQHIQVGDIFQAVYGRMESGRCEGNSFNAFMQLCKINPSPYQFYLRTDNGALLGASPELACKVVNTEQGQRLTISPIAGSRPVIADRQANLRQQIRLRTDAKELAEHVMLMDLARNDIASIAKPGSTQVEEAFTVKQYSHIQHLVSTVTGILRPEFDAMDAYFATMNMGTLTGAPKPKAMQLIAQYENNARGFFGGGFGLISGSGELHTCIVIRSMRVKGNRIYLRAGGGIVADSHPGAEYEETQHKMAACKRALALANQGAGNG